MHNPDAPRLRLIAPPPVLYLGAFVLGGTLHVIFPWWILLGSAVPILLGSVLCLLSAVIARWAFLTLRRMGTSAAPQQPSTALATVGPFRFSRNPIYVAMTGLYGGLGLMINSVWPIVLLAPLLLLMVGGVIRREERYLSEKFGDTYRAYMSRVRRWL